MRMRTFIVAMLASSPAIAQQQPQIDPFAGVPPLAWAERARDVLRAQRNEATEKYTNAEIALGVLAAENQRLKARIEELEKQKPSAFPTVPTQSETQP